MKTFVIALSILGMGLTASADSMAPATLDITCVGTGTNSKSVIRIVSNAKGSAVLINGQIYPGEQLIAGTEGGPAYLQAVSNAGQYNITVSGGDLVKAFENSTTIEKGTATAYVQLFRPEKSYKATCTGSFSFQQ